MPRPPTARPAGEHLTTLTRVLRQVDVDKTIPPRRKTVIKQKLTEALNEFQQLMTEPRKKR